MKLHLPSGLRKALFACLAALSLPVTIASGSAVLYMLAANEAQAAGANVTSSAEWHDFLVGSGNRAGGEVHMRVSSGTNFYFDQSIHDIYADVYMDENLVVNNGFSAAGTNTFYGNFYGSGNISFYYSAAVQNQYLHFRGDMSNYSGDINITSRDNKGLYFEGNKSGTGSIMASGNTTWGVYVMGAAMNNSSIQTSNLTIGKFGDKSESVFKVDNILLPSSGSGYAFTVQQGASAIFQASEKTGTSLIQVVPRTVMEADSRLRFEKNVVAEFTQGGNPNALVDVTMGAGSSLEVGAGAILRMNNHIRMAQGSSVSVEGEMTLRATGDTENPHGSFNAEGGSSVAVKKGGSLTLEDASLSSFGEGSSLSVDEGGRLTLSGGTLNVSDASLTVRPGSIIAVNVANATNATKLRVSENCLSGVLNVQLLGLTDYSTEWTYSLFADGSFIPTEVSIDSTTLPRGLTGVYHPEENGSLSLNGKLMGADLVWQGGSFTWDIGSAGWTTSLDDKKFHPLDNVEFTGSAPVEVTVVDGVRAGNVVVSSGDYTFKGGALKVEGSKGLQFSGDAKARFEGAGVVAGSITASGNSYVVFAAGNVGNDTSGCPLTIEDGATVVVSTTGNKAFATANTDGAAAHGITIQKGGTLRVESPVNGTWHGHASGEGTIEIAYGGLSNLRDDFSVLHLGNSFQRLVRNEDIGAVRLVNNSVLQATSSNPSDFGTTAKEAFGHIKNLYIENGSAFAHRVGVGAGTIDFELGSAENTVYIAGEGVATVNSVSYTGALMFGIALGLNGSFEFKLNSGVVLTDDATIYVDVKNQQYRQTAKLSAGNSTGAFASNGNTLRVKGGGILELGANFHTAEDDVAGKIDVWSGTLRLNYSSVLELMEYDVKLAGGTNLQLGANGANSQDGYVIGALQGAAADETSDGAAVELSGADSGKLHFYNDYTERQAENTYSGTIAANIALALSKGYQAIETAFTGALNVSVSVGTLDLEDSSISSNGFVATVEKGGTLKLGRVTVEAGADRDHITNINATLTDGATLDMSEVTLGDPEGAGNITAFITSEGSSVDMSSVRGGTGVAIWVFMDPTESDDPDGEPIKSTLDASNISLGAGSSLFVDAVGSQVRMPNARFDKVGFSLTMNNSTAEVSGATLGRDSLFSLYVVYGGEIIMENSTFAPSTEPFTIVSWNGGGYVSLAGSTLNSEVEMAPGENDIPEPVVVSAATITVTSSGGVINLSDLTLGEGAKLVTHAEEPLKGDTRIILTGTGVWDSLSISIADSSVVLEGITLGKGNELRIENRATLTIDGQSHIVLDESMMDADAKRVINFVDGGGALNALDGAALMVEVTEVLPKILEDPDAETTYYITNADLTSWSGLGMGAEVYLLNLKVKLTADGGITFKPLAVNRDTIYWSTQDNAGDGKTVWNAGDDVYASMDGIAAVYVDNETNLDLRGANRGTRTDGLTLNNLMSTKDGVFNVMGDGSGKSMITISNNLSRKGLDRLEKELNIRIADQLTLAGDVNVNGADLQIRHRNGDTGAASPESVTLMTGVLKLRNGQLRMTSGVLELAADGNDLGDVGICFAGNDAMLKVSGATSVGGQLSVEGVSNNASEREEHIAFGKLANLMLKDGTRVNTGVTIGSVDEGDRYVGTVTAQKGAQQMELDSHLSGVVLHLSSGSRMTIVDIGGQDAAAEPIALDDEPETEQPMGMWRLAGITGDGALASTTDNVVDIAVGGSNRIFSGDLSEYKGTFRVLSGSLTQYFNGVKGGETWNLVNTAGGRVVFDLMSGSKSNELTMGQLTLESGSYTTILADLAQTKGHIFLKLQGLRIEDEADVTIGQYQGTITLDAQDGLLTRVLGKISVEDDTEIGSNVHWHLKGIRNATDIAIREKDGTLYMDTIVDNSNRYARFADNSNSLTGATLLWGVQNTANLGGDLAAIDAWLYGTLIEGKPTAGDVAKANKLMAAAAGASTAVLADALNTDMERQLRAIRNRTTSLVLNGGEAGERMNSGLWLNAENSYHKQKSDRMMPGYKANGWGGTVGAYTEVGGGTAIGLALTAMYNDVESEGPDRIKGDMDTYYLSAFAQVAHNAWRHTFVCSVGTASMDMKRTVAYDGGAYTTKGSTDGLSFGLLYEVGYTMPLNVDYSVCWQPVFNISWRVNQLDAYTERGSNAALHVEEQTYNAVTFGAGARLQAAVGENAFNRTALLEGRAIFKVDAGSRRGRADVSLVNAGAARGTVQSAEKGAVGVELGTGISLPTGRNGETFADFSAELRSNYTDLNATIGYRVNF